MVIAEDEEIERKALNLLIMKEFPDIQVVGLASNGAELVSLINRHRPDMAIVDINMPAMSGIDAIELIRGMDVPTRFIINTAYSDFTYAQRALAMKVEYYILKPQKRAETIETIRALCRAIDEAQATTKSRAQINELFSNIQPVLESEILYSIFMGEPAAASLAMWSEMHGTTFEGGVMVSCIPLAHKDALRGQNKEELRAFLHSSMQDVCTFLATASDTGLNMLVFVPPAKRDSWRQWLRDVLLVQNSKLAGAWGLTLTIGVGNWYAGFESMHESYQESLIALRTLSPGEVNFYKAAVENVSGDYLVTLAGRLVRSFAEGGHRAVDEILQEAEKVLLQGDTVTQLWGFCNEEMVRRGFAVEDAGTLYVAVLDDIRSQLDSVTRLAALAKGLHSLAEQVCVPNDAGGVYVQKAVAVMENRFAEDLSLDGVAEEIGISPFYLSRLMKKEAGRTFVEQLTDIRMREAVRLVKGSRLPVKEIAERTGYANHTYFCRVFKKHTGQTISGMREEAR